MSQYLKNFKNRVRESLYESLSEIFDSGPFQRTFQFYKYIGSTVKVESFRDPKGNLVDITFSHWERGLYELDFSINGDSYDNPEVSYTLTDYSKLLNTIAEAVSQFLEKYEPEGLGLGGADGFAKLEKNPKYEGQKNRIYHAFVSRIQDLNNNYVVDRDNKTGDIALIRKPISEFLERV